MTYLEKLRYVMKLKYTTEQFVQKANKKHNKKYQYMNTIYAGAKKKVKITCPLHGEFEQAPSSHLAGIGCAKCARDKQSERLNSTKKTFVKKANKVHNNAYDYTNTIYTNVRTKLKIKCPTHGIFEQLPSNHLAGNGCPTCAKPGWSYSAWKSTGEKSKYFDSFKLYIIECWNQEERFLKIGKTFTTLGKRFRHFSIMPYEWKLIIMEIGSAEYISNKEKELHNIFSTHTYKPNIKFSGDTECFDISIKQNFKEN